MIRFLLLAAVFGGLSWIFYRQGMPDPLLGVFVGTAVGYGSAFALTWSARRRLRTARRSATGDPR